MLIKINQLNNSLASVKASKARKALKMSTKICEICDSLYVQTTDEEFFGCSIFETLCQRCNIIMHEIDFSEYKNNKDRVIEKFEKFSDDKETNNFINFAESEF